MRINHNLSAMNAHRLLTLNSEKTSKVLEKLSSGKRINRAADDAAGMAISEKMHSQIKGLRMASRNSLDGVSLIQTAEGALGEVHSMLQRMRELAVQAGNGTLTSDDRETIQEEVNQLTSEINRVGETTQFNQQELLKGNGTDAYEVELQIGANANQTFTLEILDMRGKALGISGTPGTTAYGTTANVTNNGTLSEAALDFTKQDNIDNCLEKIDTAIKNVSAMRSGLGAYQNRLEHTITNIDNAAENLTSALSRTEDTDMALAMSEFTKLNILQQAGTAMMAQANQRPQSILQLLQ